MLDGGARQATGRNDPTKEALHLFRSFWMGGFEGADHLNSAGLPLDPAGATRHLRHAATDYERLARLGIRTVRESLGWRLTETSTGFDFSRMRALTSAAQQHDIQILWTLHHYGLPAGVTYLDDRFIDRFVRYAAAAARQLRQLSADAPVYTLVNELNFVAWAVAQTKLLFPYRGDADDLIGGYRIKRRLVRATLLAMDAILAIDPRASFLHVEPIVHVVAPAGAPERTREAAELRAYQWQSWDMLAGRLEPELGGHEEALGVLGINHYHSSQWEVGTERRLHWHERDPRRVPLSALLAEVHERYGRPVMVAETGHFGRGRGVWLDEMAAETFRARQRGVSVEGFCIYPVLDRSDWENVDHWHTSGIWDLPPDAAGRREQRRLCFPYARSLRRWQRRFEAASNPRAPMKTLIVFSHLRWDFVYQRPQHLLSRLARHYRVLFFEEPVRGNLTPFLERFSPCHNLEVLRPHTTIDAPGFHDAQLPELQPLLSEYLRDFRIDDYIVWFYTPMALPLLSELEPRAVIYDCMDELAAFKNAPRQMLQRESALLKRADLVLTGGPSLYEAKRDLHANVHCLPSAVDAKHYSPHSERAADPEADRLMADIPRPRLGFFGVIDERFDIELLQSLADADPRWQIVLAGPVVKIDRAALPRGANIHFLGHQPYERLPHLVHAWDACLLPFALNASTRFISPTKTLEYMAAEKPIISTPVHDVAKLYRDAVAIAPSHAAFIEACRDALTEDAEARAVRIARMRRHVERTTWDAAARAIVHQIEELMKQDGLRSAPRHGKEVASRPAATEPLRVHSGGRAPAGTVPALVVGAGPTGLAAAYHLGKDALLVEREATVGGWCRSIVDRGFTFDFAGHIMFSNDPYVLALYDKLLGDNQHWQNREAWIFSKGVYTRYPFQGSLYGLPPKVLKECIVGAIEARFGPLKGKDPAPPSITEQPPANFEEFIYRVWGSGIAKHFAVPYNRKLWAVPLNEMETSWLGGRVPLPDLEQMIEGALEPTPPPMGPNARFGYPLRGGFQALMNAFLPHMTGEVALSTRVLSVSPKRRTAALSDGRTIKFDTLISTMPLPALVAACGDEVPGDVRAAARALRHVSVRCVNLGVARENITEKHWIYYPEDTVFHRIFVQGNASPHCNPPGGFGLTCEITYSDSKPLPLDGAALIERCRQDCIKVSMLRPDDVLLAANQVDMPVAYVVYDHERAANVELIRGWMAQHRIILAGRYSEWEYYNSDHAFVAGRKAAEQALNAAHLADKVVAI